MNIKNTCDVIEQTGAVGCTTVDLHRSCLFWAVGPFSKDVQFKGPSKKLPDAMQWLSVAMPRICAETAMDPIHLLIMVR